MNCDEEIKVQIISLQRTISDLLFENSKLQDQMERLRFSIDYLMRSLQRDRLK